MEVRIFGQGATLREQVQNMGFYGIFGLLFCFVLF